MTRTIRPIKYLAGAAALALAPLAVAACGGGGATASMRPKAASTAAATVGVANSGLGRVLVDSQGRTLYLFTKDSGTTSSCTGACASAWPPLQTQGTPTAVNGANASLVGSTTRSDGTTQVTYNGHPLYTFVKDQKPGETNGQGKTAFGGQWFAVTTAGNQAGHQSSPPAPKPAPRAAAPAPKPAPEAPAPKPAPEPPAPKPAPERAAPPAPKPAPEHSGIPQNNGGDGDADNNGGPSDGDGEI